MKRIKYAANILNIVVCLMFVYHLYDYINYCLNFSGSGGDAWGGIMRFYSLLLWPILLAVDLGVQEATKDLSDRNRVIARNALGLLVVIITYLIVGRELPIFLNTQ